MKCFNKWLICIQSNKLSLYVGGNRGIFLFCICWCVKSVYVSLTLSISLKKYLTLKHSYYNVQIFDMLGIFTTYSTIHALYVCCFLWTISFGKHNANILMENPQTDQFQSRLKENFNSILTMLILFLASALSQCNIHSIRCLKRAKKKTLNSRKWTESINIICPIINENQFTMLKTTLNYLFKTR